MKKADIAIIGGGAAGLFAAIIAARNGASVIISERLPRVGKKLLSTGNGRCNITNLDLDISHYHGQKPSFAKNILKEFDYNKTCEFFGNIGIPFVTQENNKVYPKSLQASSVLDLLRIECQRLGVIEMTDFFVTDIKTNPFVLISETGDKITAKKIILAAGGKSAPSFGTDGSAYSLAKKFGHSIVTPVPSLVQLKTESPIRSLKGIKHICTASVLCNGEHKTAHGEVLFTEYGLSGPPIFDLSRIAAMGIARGDTVTVTLNLLPEYTLKELQQFLSQRAEQLPHLTSENFLNGVLNKRLGFEICKRAKDTNDIARLINRFTFKITGTMPWANSQVTAGGIDVSDIENTLESKKIKGLYFAGEILDIDGDCGGYNLQWAWSSAYVAAKCAVKSLEERNA